MMSSNPSSSANSLPEDFFDSNKKSKKEQQDEIARALEEKKKEIAAREADLEKRLEEQFDLQQDDTNIDEINQQLKQWERFAELEKKAQKLQEKSTIDRMKTVNNQPVLKDANADCDTMDGDEDPTEDLFDWRSRGL